MSDKTSINPINRLMYAIALTDRKGWFTQQEIKSKIPQKVKEYREIQSFYWSHKISFPEFIKDYWESGQHDLAIDLGKQDIKNIETSKTITTTDGKIT